jgi:hypothetical protein
VPVGRIVFTQVREQQRSLAERARAWTLREPQRRRKELCEAARALHEVSGAGLGSAAQPRSAPHHCRLCVFCACVQVCAAGADSRAAVRAVGGVPPLIRLLDCDLEELQHGAAVALGNLCCNEPPSSDVVRAAGGIQALLAHGLASFVPRLQDAAAFAVGNLCVDNPESQQAGGAAGGIEALVILLAAPAAAVRKQAARALRTACDGCRPNLVKVRWPARAHPGAPWAVAAALLATALFDAPGSVVGQRGCRRVTQARSRRWLAASAPQLQRWRCRPSQRWGHSAWTSRCAVTSCARLVACCDCGSCWRIRTSRCSDRRHGRSVMW